MSNKDEKLDTSGYRKKLMRYGRVENVANKYIDRMESEKDKKIMRKFLEELKDL